MSVAAAQLSLDFSPKTCRAVELQSGSTIPLSSMGDLLDLYDVAGVKPSKDLARWGRIQRIASAHIDTFYRSLPDLSPLEQRDLAIVALHAFTMLRPSQIRAMDRADFLEGDFSIFAPKLPKCKISGDVPLHPRAYWVMCYHAANVEADSPLFVSQDGDRLSLKGIQRVMAKALDSNLYEDQVVYFIERPQDSKVKIGISRDVESRMAAIKASCGMDLRLLGCMNGGRTLERMLHSKFSALRVTGEWFRLEGSLKDFIAKTFHGSSSSAR